MLEWILGILLVFSLGGNLVQLFTGLKVEATQNQQVQNYNVNQNANLNIFGENAVTGKVAYKMTSVKDLGELTNFMQTLEPWSFVNAKINEIKPSGFLVIYPVVVSESETNIVSVTNSSTNYVKIGLGKRE